MQFLVFHLCSRDEETCRELTELLFTKLVDVSEAGSIRLAAAAYFASFLARAKHLTPEFVCDLLKRLVDWCLSHVKQRTTPGSVALSGAMEKTKVGMPPPPPHQALAVFDSACQAMMYVICYRAEDISRAGGTTAMKLQSLPLCEVLYSHLRPLATCLPSVVTEFLHRAVGANMNGFTSVLLKEHMERMATGSRNGRLLKHAPLQESFDGLHEYPNRVYVSKSFPASHVFSLRSVRASSKRRFVEIARHVRILDGKRSGQSCR